jgi:hypothetical protein
MPRVRVERGGDPPAARRRTLAWFSVTPRFPAPVFFLPAQKVQPARQHVGQHLNRKKGGVALLLPARRMITILVNEQIPDRALLALSHQRTPPGVHPETITYNHPDHALVIVLMNIKILIICLTLAIINTIQ